MTRDSVPRTTLLTALRCLFGQTVLLVASLLRGLRLPSFALAVLALTVVRDGSSGRPLSFHPDE
jgi:hypothetical protein